MIDQNGLLEIPGIDEEKAKLYGARFLKLILQCRHSFESMMQQQQQQQEEEEEDIPDDPNHRTVVDLLSSDNDDPSFSFEIQDGESSQEEQSSYFSNSAVHQFNERRKSTRHRQ